MRTRKHMHGARTSVATSALVTLMAACGGSQPPPIPATPIAVAPAGPASSAPSMEAAVEIPPAGTLRDIGRLPVVPLPTKTAPKGIAIVDHALPVVHLRVAIGAGHAAASSATKAGLSRAGIETLTAKLLRDGGAGNWNARALAEKIDGLGTELSIEIGADEVVLGLSVTSDKASAAIELLGAMVARPKLDAGELAKLTAREIDRVKQAATSSGGWLARRALYGALFGAGHPYAEPDGTAATFGRITRNEVVEFWKREYVDGNVHIVVAGDVEPAAVATKLDAAFAGLPKGSAPKVEFPPIPARGERRVLLIRKPSAQADVILGQPVLARNDARWEAFSLGMYSLGGGATSRLFVDVREKRSLAYQAAAASRELAHGPSVAIMMAGTQTKLAAEGVGALLENARALSTTAELTDDELTMAKKALDVGAIFDFETIDAVAGLAIEKDILGLPGADVYGYLEAHRKKLRETARAEVLGAVRDTLRDDGWVIAVAGEESLAEPLRMYGPVTVLDPQADLAPVRTLERASPTVK
jgi:zinc protease